MVVSLVHALVVLDLAQLGVELDTTVALPLHAGLCITINNATNDIAIPLSPFLCPKKHAQRGAKSERSRV